MRGHCLLGRAVRAVAVLAVVSAATTAPADVFNMDPGLTSLEFVTVNDLGNPADPRVMNDGTSDYGAVDYSYRISRYPVTNAQYTVFLNAVDPGGINPNGLYNVNMGTNPRGGITFDDGADDGAKYAAKPDFENKPVNYVSFFSAMRFVNWLENGQGDGGTESGTYEIGDGLSETRAAGARYVVPTEDEWYKAAHHDPMRENGAYWLYPTRSDDIPTVAIADASGDIINPGVNVANYNMGAVWNGVNGNVTTVGSAGPQSAGFYGTFDQGGNVFEWNEAVIDANRGVRGGSWTGGEGSMRATFRSGFGPQSTFNFLGFRVAEIPEPGDDVTPPTVTLITPADGAVFALNEAVAADYFCEDEAGGSGLASCEGTVAAGEPIDTATVGEQHFTVTAVDHAGNSTQVTHTYRVAYDLVGAGGFGPPVANPPALNVARAGSTVPVKWRLPDGMGGFLCDPDVVIGLLVQRIDCGDLTSALGEAEAAPSAGGTRVRCQDGQYIFNWKTARGQAGGCYRLILMLDDGSEHEVLFSLR